MMRFEIKIQVSDDGEGIGKPVVNKKYRASTSLNLMSTFGDTPGEALRRMADRLDEQCQEFYGPHPPTKPSPHELGELRQQLSDLHKSWDGWVELKSTLDDSKLECPPPRRRPAHDR